jgi:hypothetical protein
MKRWQARLRATIKPRAYYLLPRSVRKLFYPLELRIRSIRQRRLDAISRTAMSQSLSAVAARNPPVSKHFFYGASAICSKHLVTWYIFRTDVELREAEQHGLTADLERLTRSNLTNGGYPNKGARYMHVSFTSEEDIQRQSGGNYRDYFA